MDILLAAPVIVLLSPILSVAAIAVKLSSRVPAIFKQERVVAETIGTSRSTL
ncbi:MAG: sugar transferase [Sedimentisphaerales bacterium]